MTTTTPLIIVGFLHASSFAIAQKFVYWQSMGISLKPWCLEMSSPSPCIGFRRALTKNHNWLQESWLVFDTRVLRKWIPPFLWPHSSFLYNVHYKLPLPFPSHIPLRNLNPYTSSSQQLALVNWAISFCWFDLHHQLRWQVKSYEHMSKHSNNGCETCNVDRSRRHVH